MYDVDRISFDVGAEAGFLAGLRYQDEGEQQLREAVENVLRWDWALTFDSADWPPARDAAVQYLHHALQAAKGVGGE